MDQVQIFLSYAHADEAEVRELYHRLQQAGFKPWLDAEELLPGVKWLDEIARAIRASEFFLLCLSPRSADRRGVIQREIKVALDVMNEKLHSDIYFIPARLEACTVPDEVSHYQWVDLFREGGWEKLLRALHRQLERSGKTVPVVKPASPTFTFETVTLDAQGREISRRSLQAEYVREDLGDGVYLDLVRIPAGEFLMGAPDNEEGRSKDEGPQHRVRVPEFFMGRYAVTRGQWRQVARWPKAKLGLQEDPACFKDSWQQPVENVSWNDATEFCARLALRTGKRYRLPSEAEWEYAARAGTTTPFAFGPTITPQLVNYNGNYPYGNVPGGEYRQKTTPGGSLGVANAWGLYDMHGNVWEWCEDQWHGSYDGAPADGSAWVDISAAGSTRVNRGGGWFIDAVYCRSALRYYGAPGGRDDDLGFRLLRADR